MVIGEALMIFPFLVASVTERLGENFRSTPFLKFEQPAKKGS